MNENLKLAVSLAAMYTAHPWEPFPIYKPKGRWQKVHFGLICLRWFLAKRFIKRKSFLDGFVFD